MKTFTFAVLIFAGIFSVFFQPVVFCQEQEMEGLDEINEFDRGIDRVSQRGNDEGWDIFERWGVYLFGEKSIDPLADTNEAQQAQDINEGVDERVETAAEYTEAAVELGTAGLPAPSAASEVGQRAVGTAVDAATDEEPGIVGQFFNWLGEVIGGLVN